MDLPESEMPESCYVFIHASPGSRVGIVKRGVGGFLITRIDQKDLSDAEARMLVNALNTSQGITAPVAAAMLNGATTGWRCAHWDKRMAA